MCKHKAADYLDRHLMKVDWKSVFLSPFWEERDHRLRSDTTDPVAQAPFYTKHKLGLNLPYLILFKC